jgi:hypothetical protein
LQLKRWKIELGFLVMSREEYMPKRKYAQNVGMNFNG